MSSIGCDIVVVGGGPAGSTAALTLAREGCHVVLLEGSRYEQPRVGETLPPSARPLLRQLGLWETFLVLDATPSHGNQSAWGGPDVWSNSFIYSPHGNGWHLDRCRFDALLAEMAATAGATLLTGRRVTACKPAPPGGWRITLEHSDSHPSEITASAVIDATGRRSRLARWLGAKRRVHDHLVGVAAAYSGAFKDAGYTLVEATKDGWWYSAPVPPNRLMVMFMTDADLCRSGHRSDPEVWSRTLSLTEHTRLRVDDHEQVWGPRVFSAVSHRLERAQLTSPWLACGDAAIGVDPLSSSGILRALRTGESAGRATASWLCGRPEDAYAYEQNLDREFASYWRERSAYYRLETRWPDAPFWQRRLDHTPGP